MSIIENFGSLKIDIFPAKRDQVEPTIEKSKPAKPGKQKTEKQGKESGTPPIMKASKKKEVAVNVSDELKKFEFKGFRTFKRKYDQEGSTLALELLDLIRFGGNVTCLKCNYSQVYNSKTKEHSYICAGCKKQFDATFQLPFSNGKIDFVLWLEAIVLDTMCKGGITASELAQFIEVSLKTATLMLQVIRRYGYRQDRFKFNNIDPIEADHGIFGGELVNVPHSRKPLYKDGKNKTEILVLSQRNGNAFATVVSDKELETTRKVIRSIAPFGSTIITDASNSFNGLKGIYTSYKVNKSKNEHLKSIYIDGILMLTNNAENFFTLFKGAMRKFNNAIPKSSVQDFLNGVIYRRNTRNYTPLQRVISVLENIICSCEESI